MGRKEAGRIVDTCELLEEGERCLQAMHGILAAVDEHHLYIRAGLVFGVEELEKRLEGIEAILKVRREQNQRDISL